MKTGVPQPLIRIYMDDLTITTYSVTESRSRRLEKLIVWARINFKLVN